MKEKLLLDICSVHVASFLYLYCNLVYQFSLFINHCILILFLFLWQIKNKKNCFLNTENIENEINRCIHVA